MKFNLIRLKFPCTLLINCDVISDKGEFENESAQKLSALVSAVAGRVELTPLGPRL